ncbi:glycinol 4-dimethylallyltransferase [Cajanus cajan]|uniref:glycinol 4-dimethylallyltransferase n=1 Tax=Cajanus cajan TaxID=3821 RepID=UPI00098D9D16|nr:glycinol 4-dimethylallyltransferase [Cajanus cajan]
MDSMSFISSPNACSLTTGGNLGRRQHSTNNIYYTSSFVSKASQPERKTQIECNLLRFQQPSLNHHFKGIEGQERNRRYVVKAAPAPSFDSESHVSNPKSIFDSTKNFLSNIYFFCYPYSMIARTLGTISASLIAVQNVSDISPLFFIGLLQVLIPHFFMDLYINGVNQVFDIEIDKINKPYLPLPSGKLSYTTGVTIVASSAILSFWLSGIIGSWPLFWSLAICFTLWSGYSINLPLLRWKRFPQLVATFMFASWAYIFPITFYLHMQTFVFKRPAIFPRSLIVSIAFLSFYALGIALSKDIPDVEGDTKHGIHSFSARLGQKRVFWICVFLFEMAFGVGLVGSAISSSSTLIKIITGLGHVILGSILWNHTKNIDLTSPASTRSFYMYIWKLLYVAYFLLPLAR